MSGAKASYPINAVAAPAFYMKQLWPASQGYVDWGLDVGAQVPDTGTGTSRTSTLTAYASKTAVNGGPSAWTQSVAVTAGWTSVSSSSGPFGVPWGGPDEASRNAALFGPALQNLTAQLISQLGGVA